MVFYDNSKVFYFPNGYKYISLRGFTTIKPYATVCTPKVNDTPLCYKKNHARSFSYTHSRSSYTYRHMYLAGAEAKHLHTPTHMHTYTQDIKAQGIANAEDV